MSGWIDPLAMKALYRWTRAERARLTAAAEQKAKFHPKSRDVARLRARAAEMGRFMNLIRRLQRPGRELLPHKALVNMHADRHEQVDAVVPRCAA